MFYKNYFPKLDHKNKGIDHLKNISNNRNI